MNAPRHSARLLFDRVPLPAWVVRLEDMSILDANEAASEHFGYTRQQYLGMRLGDFQSEIDVDRLREAAQERSDSSLSLRGWTTRTASGAALDIDCAVRFVNWKSAAAAIVCALDMSDQKALEERLQQAGKMEAIGMLAGGIAHDFNNLLTIISGYSQLLLNNVPERERTSVEQILKASERAAELTGQLLSFSRHQHPQPRMVDLNHVVSGMSTMLRRLIGEHIELRLLLEPGLGAVYIDPSQVDQVVMNLSANARDAMEAGGGLTIETRNVDVDQAFSCVPAGRYVSLSVTDTGVGMDKKTAARVFDPFFTTKEKGRGTGLGLSTVFGIVKRAGGSVDLQTEPEHGTCVRVYLPRMTEVANAAAPERLVAEAVGGRETILVVEDEEAVRRLVRATLERRGYHVLVAGSGQEALRICAEFDGPIELLLTDLVMPQMSGTEVAQRVSKLRPTTRVLCISGYTDRSVQRTIPLPKDAEFLQKPFTPIALARCVRKVLDRNSNPKSSTSRP